MTMYLTGFLLKEVLLTKMGVCFEIWVLVVTAIFFTMYKEPETS